MLRASPERIVIVGGGVAADRCAWQLRRLGFERSLTMLAGERHAPYDRTMLSKEMLTGDVPEAELALRPAGEYAAAGIDLRLGSVAAGLDADRSCVELASGESVPYDRLVVCTGATPSIPRTLQHARARVVRERPDAAALRDDLAGSRRVVIVGGGVLGGELASFSVAHDAQTTLVEAADAPLGPVLGSEVGERIRALHEAHGVQVLAGAQVTAVDGPGALAVQLADGRSLAGDTVVVAVGMRPAVGWLNGSGIDLRDGVLSDACCRTSVPGVFAAGDCARWHNERYGVTMRVEHWDTAARHGAAAAAAVLGSEAPFAPVPFWWTDVHGVKLQVAGVAAGADRVEIEDGPAGAAFVARYWLAGELLAVAAVDQPRVVAAARRELESTGKEGSIAA